MNSKKDAKWKSFTLEIFAIIFGILIAFGVENFSEESKEAKIREFYFSELLVNLEKDVIQIQNVLAEQSEIMTIISNFQERFELMGKENAEKLFAKTISNTSFFPTMGAYRAMVSEGSLHLINDKKVTSSLVELYEFNYERAVYLGSVLDTEVARIMWDLKKYYSLVENKFFSSKDVKSREFKALLEHRMAYINLYLSHLEKTQERSKAMIEILKNRND